MTESQAASAVHTAPSSSLPSIPPNVYTTENVASIAGPDKAMNSVVIAGKSVKPNAAMRRNMPMFNNLTRSTSTNHGQNHVGHHGYLQNQGVTNNMLANITKSNSVSIKKTVTPITQSVQQSQNNATPSSTNDGGFFLTEVPLSHGTPSQYQSDGGVEKKIQRIPSIERNKSSVSFVEPKLFSNRRQQKQNIPSYLSQHHRLPPVQHLNMTNTSKLSGNNAHFQKIPSQNGQIQSVVYNLNDFPNSIPKKKNLVSIPLRSKDAYNKALNQRISEITAQLSKMNNFDHQFSQHAPHDSNESQEAKSVVSENLHRRSEKETPRSRVSEKDEDSKSTISKRSRSSMKSKASDPLSSSSSIGSNSFISLSSKNKSDPRKEGSVASPKLSSIGNDADDDRIHQIEQSLDEERRARSQIEKALHEVLSKQEELLRQISSEDGMEELSDQMSCNDSQASELSRRSESKSERRHRRKVRERAKRELYQIISDMYQQMQIIEAASNDQVIKRMVRHIQNKHPELAQIAVEAMPASKASTTFRTNFATDHKGQLVFG